MTDSTKLYELIDAMDWDGAQALTDRSDELQNSRGPDGQSPVQEAIYRGGQAFAQHLADRGRVLDVFECTVLNQTAKLESLLKDTPEAAHANSYDGWTALHLAGFVGAQDCAALLIQHGAVINAISSNGMANSPLSATLAGSGDLAIVRLLLEAGGDPNVSGAGAFTPLHLAASRGAAEAIQLLRGAGAMPTPAESGQTPADLARERGFPEVAESLE